MAMTFFQKALLAFGVLALTNVFLSSRSSSDSPTVAALPSPTRDRWIVITTIQAPTAQVRFLCALPNWTTVIVADYKTPWKPWQEDKSHGCAHFLSVQDQVSLGYSIVAHLPLNNYGRKNVGYLFAIQHGAREIYETDDDNQPSGAGVAMLPLGEEPFARVADPALRVQNPYAFFGRPDIWPRGYPLNKVNASRAPRVAKADVLCPQKEYPIQQGIVDLDPDVDAIFRMTQAPSVGKVKFRTDRGPLALGKGTYCPYNTQNTLSRYKAFWGLLVPVTTTMRVCDIWRSYWVQRVLWDIGEELLFLPATAEQVRNPHDFHKDFLEELDLYTKAGDLIATLDSWDPPAPEAETLFGRIGHLGRLLAERGFWGEADARLMEAWLADLVGVGYIPPRLVGPCE